MKKAKNKPYMGPTTRPGDKWVVTQELLQDELLVALKVGKRFYPVDQDRIELCFGTMVCDDPHVRPLMIYTLFPFPIIGKVVEAGRSGPEHPAMVLLFNDRKTIMVGDKSKVGNGFGIFGKPPSKGETG